MITGRVFFRSCGGRLLSIMVLPFTLATLLYATPVDSPLYHHHSQQTAKTFAAGVIVPTTPAQPETEGSRHFTDPAVVPECGQFETDPHWDPYCEGWTDPGVVPECGPNWTDPVFDPSCITIPNWDPNCMTTPGWGFPECDVTWTDPAFYPECDPNWTDPDFYPDCDPNWTDPDFFPEWNPDWTNPDFFPECIPSALNILDFRGYGSSDGVTLNWRTADESGLQGFRILRSEASELHFNSLTAELLPIGSEDNSYSYIDAEVGAGTEYVYQLQALSGAGNVVDSRQITVAAANPAAGELPASLALYRNYPNPANPSTNIEFVLTAEATGTYDLTIYNLQGEVVANLAGGPAVPGYYHYTWDGSRLSASGLFVARLRVGDQSRALKIMLVK